MSSLFTSIIVQPILNLLVWLYDVVPGNDLGVAIIILTILVKVVLYPLTMAQIKQQRALQAIQPKIEEIRKRLKDDKEAQAKELMDLYRVEKVNPASSCLPLLIQLPIFIGLYTALRDGLGSHGLELLYPYVANPGTIKTLMFGIVDLAKPNYVLAVLAGGVQFWQSWQILRKPSSAAPPPVEVQGKEDAKDEGMAAAMNKQMMYMMPIVTVFIGISLPGGLTLYWLVMSLLTVAQQALFLRRPTPPKIEAHLS
ncbi:YidC/Oxa1 family membrane protein insertase [Patescibacteria group bacterium]|nr:YidC/Oxa1 family membrane protein insertase [Patescibacteria group bacterium]MBU1448299.1 YidC/Oxa1 family membrane protein insertase [Patescibacteria group bacterium]